MCSSALTISLVSILVSQFVTDVVTHFSTSRMTRTVYSGPSPSAIDLGLKQRDRVLGFGKNLCMCFRIKPNLVLAHTVGQCNSL